MDFDFIVGFTIFTKKGFKTMYRHFDKLETAKLFASNNNLKNNCKIYVDLDYYNKNIDKLKDAYTNLLVDKDIIKTIFGDYLRQYEKSNSISVGILPNGENCIYTKIKMTGKQKEFMRNFIENQEEE